MKNVQMKQATELLKAIGLIETTSPRQLKNGTLEFSDPKDMPVKYTLHANGYYRKYISSGYFSHAGGTECYQLNRTEKIPYVIPPSSWNPKGFTGFSIARIQIPGEYLLMAARIVKIALNSRKRK